MHRRKDGSTFQVEISTTFLPTENQFVVFIRDISERKQAEDALRVSEENYRMLFESANDAIFVYHTSPDGMPSKFININQKASEMLGYSSEELLTFSPDNLVVPEKLSVIPGIVEEKKKKGGNCIFEITLLCKDGRHLEVEISDHSFIVKGTPYTLSIVRDVTDRKKVEAALKYSKLQLEAVFNNLDAAIYIADISSHEILYTNDYMTNVWGKDLTGHICWQSIHKNKTGPCEFCSNDKLIDDDGNSTDPYIWELYNYRVNRWYEVHDQAIPWANGKLVRLSVAIDITERKNQEDQKLEASLQKEQFRKLQSLKTMAGAIAHRFNNAMMVVQGNLELMTLTLPVGSSEYEMASNAAKAASGASQVGSMMLSYVGQRPLKRQDIPLDILARESVTPLKTLLHPSIALRFTPPEKRLYCSVDQQQIKEVIESILTNAIEALDDGVGTIQISFGTDYFTTDLFPVAFQNDSIKDGVYTYCQIKDTGHGVEPRDLSRIFEPFFTTRFVGRGLGLALTVGVMQSHHGAITIESVLGQGTTVRVLLPSVSPTQQMIPSDDYQSEGVKLSGNILIADDEEMVLDVGRQMLELLGFTVHTAMDGQEAVGKIRKNDIDFCAIVLDISMPKTDGIEAMNIIRGINPTLPILLSSGYSEDDLPFNEGKGNKPDGFLSKPFQLFNMERCLEELLS